MVFLHDALGQGKSLSPSALLGGVAGAEHVADVARGDAFAGVGDFDDYVRTAPEYVQVYATGSCHGVDGVFAEVLNDPFKERGIELGTFYFGVVSLHNLGGASDEQT